MDLEFMKYKFQDGYDGVITKSKCQVGVRHVQVAYMVLCAVAMGALRSSAGVALLTMTDVSQRNDSYVQTQEWDTGVQGAVLWSFLCGHALALLPAELHLARFGDKFVVTAVLLINGSLTAAMPTIVNRKRLSVPWRSMLRCRRLAGLALAHAANNALFLFYLVDVPMYLRSTGLTLQQCGVQSMIPFIVLLTLYTTIGPTFRCLLKSNLLAHVLNVTYLWKVVNALGTLSIVSGLAVAANVPAEWDYLRLCVLIATLGLLAFQYSGFVEDVYDLSENYCGTLVVITSTFASLAGAAVPLLTGMILKYQKVSYKVSTTYRR
ncbi:PREDICTED: putative inorganic phosphate cotransporter [Papilio polytes]|uniref:putative inorganic phosphate cotransporter n=1 Tax=Papilio polytes TaxID=76194 RepID=UPI000675EB51|nr:PREDICTED: putative inorganic phosphate cotransporter [Papilio polytes]